MSAEEKFWLVSGVAVSGSNVEILTYTVTADTEEWARGAATKDALARFPEYGIRSLEVTDMTERARTFCRENPEAQPLAKQPEQPSNQQG